MYEPQVWIYFTVLFLSLSHLFSKQKDRRRQLGGILLLATTWFLIGRFTATYEGNAIFDDAYADVLDGPHASTSMQLLTWAVVAMVWIGHQASPATVCVGLLGALSAAFVLEQPPIPCSRVGIWTVLCSIVSLIALYKLDPSEADFGTWLRVLHVALVLPIFAQPLRHVTIPAWIVYASLCVAVALRFDTFQERPQTDCQLSISLDLLACCCITLFEHQFSLYSPFIVIAVPLMSVFSPGAVLAGRLCYETLPEFRTVVYRLQRLAAGSDTKWTNLGLARDSSYVDAAEGLARIVLSKLAPEDRRVLCVGCGEGAELEEVLRTRSEEETSAKSGEYDAASCWVTGIDPCCSDAAIERVNDNPRLRLLRGDATQMPSETFDILLAIDSAYHIHEKARFFREAAARAPKLVLNDFVREEGLSLFGWVVGLAANATTTTIEDYKDSLNKAGYTDVEIVEIDEPLYFFDRLLRRSGLFRHVLVAASTPPKTKRRKRVAVVGSGLAGLSAAHELAKSDHDVTIFEKRRAGGLAGHSIRLGQNVVVDVPLRMIGEGYYLHLAALCKETQVDCVSATVDCCFYGGDEEDDEGIRVVSYSKSRWINALRLLLTGELPSALALSKRLAENQEPSHDVSFGEWRRKQPESTALWALENQLSWVLSCSADRVDETPARPILSYARGLQLSVGACLRTSGPGVLRVSPTIGALERRLSFGSRVKTGFAVDRLTTSRIIDGESFDAVIVAVEPQSIRKVLQPSQFPDAVRTLNQFETQTSTIFIHSDSSLMPPNRHDWKTLNVKSFQRERNVALFPFGEEKKEQYPGKNPSPSFVRGACQITVWLNAYYPELSFGSDDVFQTWNSPYVPSSLLARPIVLDRVVQSKHTLQLISQVSSLQGQNRVYFAGSHTVFGMGLLEQAVISGRNAAHLAISQLAAAPP